MIEIPNPENYFPSAEAYFQNDVSAIITGGGGGCCEEEEDFDD